ncbi:Flp family type IVb pilin [Methyloferula stellata]|uniref:Flp family type IVb pilin n=1 Tax=Methyloferula stellata TaxID=876270 RepID=UPI000365FD78|nr:Flp family type IVb pilin [Methyloferula stellata]
MLVIRFLRDTKAATAMEYSLIGGLVAVVIVAALTAVGTSIQAKFFGPIAGNLN